MKFGYFDDVNKEYVITTPKTPLPWINYLGTQDFFSLISNTAGGYSFYKDAKLLRLTRYRYNNSPMDQNGRYYYIKEGDTVTVVMNEHVDYDGKQYPIASLPENLMSIIQAGGLVKAMRKLNGLD